MKINKLVLGLAIIIVGLLMLLDEMGVIDFWKSADVAWPVLLMILGAAMISRRKKQYGFGSFLILWGLLELGKSLGVGFLQDVNIWSLLWPIVIIMFGLWILFARGKDRERPTEFNPFIGREKVSGDDMMDATALFSGINILNESPAFAGGHVTAAFGGAEISLQNAGVTVGETAVIDVLCAFGGVEIHVPRDWKVEVKVVPLFGGVDNKTDMSKDNTQPVKLVVKGMVAFGGVEINNR